MSRFLSGRLCDLCAYTPGEQPLEREYIKLNTNESPYAPAPGVLKAVSRQAETLNLYPDPEAKILTKKIAEHCGVEAENVIVGNGSDEILAFCFLAFCDRETGAAFADITYGFYKVYAGLCCVDAFQIPLENDFSLKYEKYFSLNKTIFIANPNAPTGMSISIESIEEILKNNTDNVVVIDEAYADFSRCSALSLVGKYDNLLVVRTMSKSRNLAGARVGFAVGSKGLINDLNRIKFSFNPYSVNRMSLAAGIAAMDDEEYFESCVSKIITSRQKLKGQLENNGFTVLPSETNFLFARHEKLSGGEICTLLKGEGILVRYFDKDRLRPFVRITVGSESQNEALIEKLKIITSQK